MHCTHDLKNSNNLLAVLVGAPSSWMATVDVKRIWCSFSPRSFMACLGSKSFKPYEWQEGAPECRKIKLPEVDWGWYSIKPRSLTLSFMTSAPCRGLDLLGSGGPSTVGIKIKEWVVRIKFKCLMISRTMELHSGEPYQTDLIPSSRDSGKYPQECHALHQ